MATELYNDGQHIVLMFSDLVPEEENEVVQANQFLLVNNGRGILLDPGGNMTYNELYMRMNQYFPPKNLDFVFASHADPDIIASLNRWLTGSTTKLLISRIWARFVPHFCNLGKTDGRVISIPDEGACIRLGDTQYTLLPAHFLHSEGNLQFYDPVSKLLFSGDLGASLLPTPQAALPVTDFAAHIPSMRGFHMRYMVANKVCRYWANMIRTLDVEGIVPQHGAPMLGKPMVAEFVNWIENLSCGIDLLTQEHYQAPKNVPAWSFAEF